MDLYNLPNVTEPHPPATLALQGVSPVLSYLAVAFSVASFIWWCIQDYRFFKSLGPGGPSYDIFGWFKVHILVRPFTLAARDTTWTGDYPDHGAHREIMALPDRKGGRPVILGIAPQRQFSQCPEKEMNARVLALFSSFVQSNPNLLQQRISVVEKHHYALFVHPSILAEPANTPEIATVANGELGHIHGDSSLHLYFSPADAKVLVERGWAQRHRCARTQPWWFGGLKNMWGIGDTFLIVYAPRNYEELDVLGTLIKASIMFMTGDRDVVKP
ncbi:uncharacterized protein A1O5_04151 [Cladophialophora psammophila CBS 110553]|uniref:Luciferase domain-containing protein n=1 Tax=Cladophialophora psammophila CBS 110553 TaxID=1182543 RepID=W9WXR3_9EURO|nr:uncharacterized protein A1O5_04151 [Cladophialophora psammophila CBS 110553]EXJ73002.1 hypothetical protein A1O5_04151 [Cladophialophora psammophila CBS 110553]